MHIRYPVLIWLCVTGYIGFACSEAKNSDDAQPSVKTQKLTATGKQISLMDHIPGPEMRTLRKPIRVQGPRPRPDLSSTSGSSQNSAMMTTSSTTTTSTTAKPNLLDKLTRRPNHLNHWLRPTGSSNNLSNSQHNTNNNVENTLVGGKTLAEREWECQIKLYTDIMTEQAKNESTNTISTQTGSQQQKQTYDRLFFLVPLIMVYWRHRNPEKILSLNDITTILQDFGEDGKQQRRAVELMMSRLNSRGLCVNETLLHQSRTLFMGGDNGSPNSGVSTDSHDYDLSQLADIQKYKLNQEDQIARDARIRDMSQWLERVSINRLLMKLVFALRTEKYPKGENHRGTPTGRPPPQLSSLPVYSNEPVNQPNNNRSSNNFYGMPKPQNPINRISTSSRSDSSYHQSDMELTKPLNRIGAVSLDQFETIDMMLPLNSINGLRQRQRQTTADIPRVNPTATILNRSQNSIASNQTRAMTINPETDEKREIEFYRFFAAVLSDMQRIFNDTWLRKA